MNLKILFNFNYNRPGLLGTTQYRKKKEIK